jgi:hypothetical protein
MSADPAGVALREFSIISSGVKKSTIDFDQSDEPQKRAASVTTRLFRLGRYITYPVCHSSYRQG